MSGSGQISGLRDYENRQAKALGPIARPQRSFWDKLSATGQILSEATGLDAVLSGRIYNNPAIEYGFGFGSGGMTPAEEEQVAGDFFNAAGLAQVSSMPFERPANSVSTGMGRPKNISGIKAYHGSPHSFDKFDMSKIGTGEGAQAYGHGLYFAENEGVAKGYRDTLANGWQLEVRDPIREAGITGKDLDSASQMLSTSYSGEAAARDWENWTGKTLTPEQRTAFDEAFRLKGGNVYEVNINADPNAFLDWDKPLSEQPEAVQRFVNFLKDKSFLARKRLEDTSTATGKDVWEKARNAFGVGQADAATKALSEAGIPGIKYLDAGSRGAGDGTRNYVVFDDKLISIVRKYGIAGASAMLGYNILDGMDEAQADELKKHDPTQNRSGW